MRCEPEEISRQLAQAHRLRLFLDYDGTLADFAPTPEHVDPNPEVVDLLTRLARCQDVQIAVISGRRLSQVEILIPVPGVLLAGTYGVELRTPRGKQIRRLSYEAIRPTMDRLKPRWEELIEHKHGFFLEDKGWSLALHARFADGSEAEEVLNNARSLAAQAISSSLFRALGGHRFLEIGPRLANKGKTVEYLLEHFPWRAGTLLYVGDDDKDEEAFDVVKARGGFAVRVAAEPCQTQADCCLGSPRIARHWLETLLARRLGRSRNP
jgi:trehalose 6-phosphate phosphatase